MSDFLDSRGKCKVLHTEDSNGNPCWKCTRNLDSMLYPESINHCFFTNCPGISVPEAVSPAVRSKTASAPTVTLEKSSAGDNLCRHCGENPIAPTRKSYCSDVCRMRSARAAYKRRKSGYVL